MYDKPGFESRVSIDEFISSHQSAFSLLLIATSSKLFDWYICSRLSLTTSSLHTVAKHDLLVWTEICELAPNGEYVPVTVDVGKHNNYQGEFLLRQGIQRR